MSKSFSVFKSGKTDYLNQPMFLGDDVSVSRYDEQAYPFFEKLIEKQLSFFWRPEEINLDKDRADFAKSSENEKHIFLSNLKYQTLLDSVQGRSPNIAFLPIVSIPELETWIETWSFSETIHSRSYTHIMRNVLPNPSEVLDDIATNVEIEKRALAVTENYDKLINLVAKVTHQKIDLDQNEELRLAIKRELFLTMVSVNVLEAIRFYVSFACSFSFAERDLMEGNAKIIKLIARDEALHLSGTQVIINNWISGKDDPEMALIAKQCQTQAMEIFTSAARQEKEWADYLFKDGSLIGLNSSILHSYIEYITNVRMKAVGYEPAFGKVANPLPWMNNWLVSDNVQVAPQESEITNYLTGQVDSSVSTSDFDDLSL